MVLCHLRAAVGSPYQILQEWLKLGLDDSFMDHGACKGLPLATRRGFFADNWRGNAKLLAVAESKRICTFECEVNVECLEYALAAEIDDGIWGGTTPEERVAIRRRRSTSMDDPGPSTKSAPCTPSLIEISPISGEPLLVG